MLINTSPTPDSTALDLLNGRSAANANKTNVPALAVDSGLEQMRGLSAPAQDGDLELLDTAGADQATGFLRESFSSQPAFALSAQANLNPQTVFNLLQ